MDRNQPHDQSHNREFSPVKGTNKINNMRRRDKTIGSDKKTISVLAHRLSALRPILHSNKTNE